MAEGYTPSDYHRQVEFSEAHKAKMEQLERNSTHRHHISTKPLGKLHRGLLAFIAFGLVAAIVFAVSTVCISTIS